MGGGNLFTGTLNLLILRAVAAEPMHGYAVGAWIRETSSGALGVEEGQLYPALHRLEARGLLRADWGRTETGRRAKFYALTREGEAILRAQEAAWRRHSEAVDTVLRAGRESPR